MGATERNPPDPEKSKASRKTSPIEALTTKKSNLFHALLKYVIPKAMNLSMASIRKVTVKTWLL